MRNVHVSFHGGSLESCTPKSQKTCGVSLSNNISFPLINPLGFFVMYLFRKEIVGKMWNCKIMENMPSNRVRTYKGGIVGIMPQWWKQCQDSVPYPYVLAARTYLHGWGLLCHGVFVCWYNSFIPAVVLLLRGGGCSFLVVEMVNYFFYYFIIFFLPKN